MLGAIFDISGVLRIYLGKSHLNLSLSREYNFQVISLDHASQWVHIFVMTECKTLSLSFKILKLRHSWILKLTKILWGRKGISHRYRPAAGFPEEVGLVRWLTTRMSPCQRVQTSSSCCPSVPACCHPTDAPVTFPPCCPDFNNTSCSWPGSSLEMPSWWLLVSSFSDEWQQGNETRQRPRGTDCI